MPLAPVTPAAFALLAKFGLFGLLGMLGMLGLFGPPPRMMPAAPTPSLPPPPPSSPSPPPPLAASPPPPPASPSPSTSPRTFANPLNIDYRFALASPSRREAADPVIVLFRGDYYLFASKSGGYWHSSDMVDWTFVVPTGLPIEAYAPAVMVFGDALYYTACDVGLYRTTDPKRGDWQSMGQPWKVGDPDLFADDDGRAYLYYGLSYNGSIFGLELDPRAGFRPLGPPFVCFRADATTHGWERRGDDNLGNVPGDQYRDGPWIEGAWMTKHDRRYYLQYAAPGTEFKTYADGVYVSSSPRGPFVYAPSSPFSSKPTGFITGAGHGATFKDKRGNSWHIASMVISVKHPFERRLGLFPVDVDADGVLHADTLFGDYPQMLPAGRDRERSDNRTGAMLLSYGKPATASSSLEGLAPAQAFDEDVKTWWSARTEQSGEWLSVDLGGLRHIEAVQANFAEHGSTALGRTGGPGRRYRLEASRDGATWMLLVDRDAADRDLAHDYLELPVAVEARHVRITSLRTTGGGPFAMRDLRIFGRGQGGPPASAPRVDVRRDPGDARNADVRWQEVSGADGYVVRFGTAPGKLYQNLEVRGRRDVALHGLNANADYHVTVDAFNDVGRTLGTTTVAAPAPAPTPTPTPSVRSPAPSSSQSSSHTWSRPKTQGAGGAPGFK